MIRFHHIILLFGAMLLSSIETSAQGGYFNLYHYTPSLNNPAMLGINSGASVLYNYRHQPVLGGESVNTHVLTAALPVALGNKDHQLTLGAGLIADNQAQFLKETRGLFSINYSVPLSKRQRLGLGVQSSFNQRRIDMSGESTDAQFQNGTFDPGLGLSEGLDGASKSYFGIDAGLFWQGFDSNAQQQFFLGFSMFNMNRPNVSFIDDPKDNLLQHWIAVAGYRVLQSGRFSVMPNLRMLRQAGNSQLSAGSWFRYQVGKNGSDNIGLGTWYNTNESFALSLELNQSNYTLAAAYNMGMGTELRNVMPDGVFEVTVGINLKGKQKKVIKEEVVEEVKEEEKEEEIKEEVVEEVKEKEVVEEVKEKEVVEEVKEEGLTPEEEAILAQTVRFAYNTNTLDASSKTFLEQVSKVLQAHPEMEVELAGHTCNWGDEAKNQELSKERAQMVKDYLVSLGVNPSQIQVKGYGETKPIADNATESGRQTNRRVEFSVIE